MASPPPESWAGLARTKKPWRTTNASLSPILPGSALDQSPPYTTIALDCSGGHRSAQPGRPHVAPCGDTCTLDVGKPMQVGSQASWLGKPRPGARRAATATETRTPGATWGTGAEGTKAAESVPVVSNSRPGPELSQLNTKSPHLANASSQPAWSPERSSGVTNRRLAHTGQ